MMTETCSNCAALQAQVSKLKKENAALRGKIARMQEAIKTALAHLGVVGSILFAVKLQTDYYLSQKSGISPRRWGFYKGARWLHDRIAGHIGCAITALKQALGA